MNVILEESYEYGLSTDGYTTFEEERNKPNCESAAPNYLEVLTWKRDTRYNFTRTALMFRTDLPSNVVIKNALLKIYRNQNYFKNVDIIFLNGDGTHPIKPAEVSDYNYLYWGSFIKKVLESEILTWEYTIIELPPENIIIKDGYIKMYVVTDNDYTNTPVGNYAPVGCTFYAGFTNPPMLELEYEFPPVIAPPTIFHLPFL